MSPRESESWQAPILSKEENSEESRGVKFLDEPSGECLSAGAVYRCTVARTFNGGESPSRDSPMMKRGGTRAATVSDAQADVQQEAAASFFVEIVHRADLAGQGAPCDHLLSTSRATPRLPPVSRAENGARICASDSRESGYSISLLNDAEREDVSGGRLASALTDGSSSCCDDDDEVCLVAALREVVHSSEHACGIISGATAVALCAIESLYALSLV